MDYDFSSTNSMDIVDRRQSEFSSDSAQRRLAAILAADVAGNRRFMEEDTDGMVAAWLDTREEVVKP
jgi:class 3 adenylate cyclase